MTIFAAAIVGAAGALMGLFVVAISVRLDIVNTGRAAATARSSDPAPSHYAVWCGVLVLIPDQPSELLGLDCILTAALSARRCCCSTVALSPNTPRPITLSRWCALGLVVSCRAGVVRPRHRAPGFRQGQNTKPPTHQILVM